MAYFNAVLLPDVGFRDRVVEYAQDKYRDISDGYCLSHKVYPHITLCEFEADEPPMIFIDELVHPVFIEANVRTGTGLHEGYSWVEWTVQKEDWIVQLQKTVRGALESEGLKVTTKQEEPFHPHMTFCRILSQKEDDVPLAMVEQSSKPWIFTIGSSDQMGQFLG